MGTRYVVDPDRKFAKAIEEASKQVDDLRPAFKAIIPSWFQSNKALFTLKGPGRFVDLRPSTKSSKRRDLGFVYPILRRNGFLEKSLTAQGSGEDIVKMGKLEMELGTATPYANYLQLGTKKMAARPFVMIGAEQTGPEAFNVRREKWIETIHSYVYQVLARWIGEGDKAA